MILEGGVLYIRRPEGINNFRWNLTVGGRDGGGQENTVLKGASKMYRPLHFIFFRSLRHCEVKRENYRTK